MLPEGWTTKPLEALTYRPISYGVLKPGDFDPAGVPMIRIQDAKNAYKVSDLWMISRSLSDEYKRTIVREGDIIFSVVGTLGECKKIDATLAGANVSRAFAVLGLHQSVSTDFVFQFLTSDKTLDWVAQTGRGGAQKVVNLGDLKALEIPLPPLPEQRRIAEILGSVDAAIDATKAVIEQTKTVKRGLLQSLLTRGIGHTEFKDSPLGEIPECWDFTRLSKHTKKIGSGITPKGGSEAYKADGIPLIRSQNVGWGVMLMDGVAYIDNAQHDKMAGTKLKNNDVLLNITGASIGRAAIYQGVDEGANVNQHVCIIRCGNDLHPHYLMNYLISELGQSEIDLSQAGGNRQGLNFENIGGFRIPLPPIAEQIRISETLARVEDEIRAENDKLASLYVLKRGLMDDLLTGKVRVPEAMELAA